MKSINLTLTVDSNTALSMSYDPSMDMPVIKADARIIKIIKAIMPIFKAVYALVETFDSIMEREVSELEKEGLSGELETLHVTELI